MPKHKYSLIIKVSWMALLACLVIKLLGGNWFEIKTDNQKFLSFCEWVDDNKPVKIVLACFISLLSCMPILCILINKERLGKYNFLFIPLVILRSIISWFIPYSSYVLDVVILLIIPLIITKFNWKRVLLCNLLVLLFQVIILLIRNLSISFGFNMNNTFVVQMIYQLDYIIMIFLFYLYNFRERGSK